MNGNIVRDGWFFLRIILILICFYNAAEAQDNPFAPRVRSDFELNAFRNIEAEDDSLVKLDLTEIFLIRYPESELRHLVLRARWNIFLTRGETAAVLGSAEQALEAEIDFFDKRRASFETPELIPGFAEAKLRHNRFRVSYYQSLTEANSRLERYRDTVRFGELGLELLEQVWGAYVEISSTPNSEYQDALTLHQSVQSFFLKNLMSAHEKLGNMDQVVANAKSSLELDSDDLLTLMTVSRVLAETLVEGESSFEDQMMTAERYALQAIDQVDSFVRESGESTLPEQLIALNSAVHSTMGLVYFQQQRYEEAENEYLAVIDLAPFDAEAYYRLGVVYANNQKAEDSLRALARAVYLNNPRAEARDALIRVYELRHGNLEGMEEFIESEGLALLGN